MTLTAAIISLVCTADPAWSPVFVGVDHAEIFRTDPRPLVIHALRVDLAAEGIEFVATPANGDAPEETDGQTTSAFLAEHGLQAAINTHFFGPCCDPTEGQPKDLRGLAVADGVVVSEPENDLRRVGDVFLLDASSPRALIVPAWTTGDPVPRIALGGEILFVGENTTAWANDTFATDRHPRTAVGVDDDGGTVYLVVVDGRQKGYSDGVTLPELADLMRDLGCDAAMNLDGGGSATMVIASEDGAPRVVNRPSGGKERVVGSNLGLRVKRLDPTP